MFENGGILGRNNCVPDKCCLQLVLPHCAGSEQSRATLGIVIISDHVQAIEFREKLIDFLKYSSYYNQFNVRLKDTWKRINILVQDMFVSINIPQGCHLTWAVLCRPIICQPSSKESQEPWFKSSLRNNFSRQLELIICGLQLLRESQKSTRCCN